MFDDCISKIADILSSQSASFEAGAPYFADPHYKAIPFDVSRFCKFAPKNERSGSGSTLCFVDGGNLDIVSAPNFSIQFLRVASVAFKEGKRKPLALPQRIESLVIVTHSSDMGDFEVKYMPVDEKQRLFLPQDFSISKRLVSQGDEELAPRPIVAAGGAARKFAEWLYGARIIRDCLTKGDVFVRDGTLQVGIEGEERFASQAYGAADAKGVAFAGVAKTSTLVTTTGFPLTASVQMLAKKHGIGGAWYYGPIAENKNPKHLGGIFVGKFFGGSRYAFRFEIHDSARQDVGAIFGELAENSRDLSFPGYPYGLIAADKTARVEMGERAALEARIKMRLSRIDGIRECLAATDAHRIISGL
ncbi:MAG: hypothetical protein CVT47_02110 [Thermoplasmata archaeon HGW-Thermoplasmata-2]|nr:MAG: hypothetical protein CVT47_02110 [Thermoplasmata archaeon HGW-Thermoplasmata-2]